MNFNGELKYLDGMISDADNISYKIGYANLVEYGQIHNKLNFYVNNDPLKEKVYEFITDKKEYVWCNSLANIAKLHYYGYDDPIMTDVEYDYLYTAILAYEELNPNDVIKNSTTKTMEVNSRAIANYYYLTTEHPYMLMDGILRYNKDEIPYVKYYSVSDDDMCI